MKKVGEEAELAFGKKNYTYMIAGLLVLGLGLLIMSLDGEEFGFGFMGNTLGPLVVLGGFIIQFFAITHNDEPEAKEESPEKKKEIELEKAKEVVA